jgi:hypothetical protein
MEKEFVPYQLSLDMKELGFDEPCMYIFDKQRNNLMCPIYGLFENEEPNRFLNAPLYQQAFRWFREKYKLYSYIGRACGSTSEIYFVEIYTLTEELGIYDKDEEQIIFNSQEEAELECLIKLIDIVKSKKL